MSSNKHHKILVVGCGGLGSEVIKILRTMGLSATVVDHEVVEISNLNRQFFFQKENTGELKAVVVARKTQSTYRACRVEELEVAYLDDFDVIFSCLDTIASRMNLNYMFFKSKSRMLVDCGVEGMKAHAKRVTKADACLYCIGELYSIEKEPHICSMVTASHKITAENRDRALNSVVFQKKESEERGRSNEKIYAEIVDLFNARASPDLRTSVFEVKGKFESIIPNTCTINSIAASIAVVLAFQETDYDFVYFDGATLGTSKVALKKDPKCFICRNEG